MLGPVFAIAAKDLRLLMRDWASVFFTLVFPLMVALFFGFVFGGGGDGGGGGGKMDVALVNEDGGPASKGFADDIASDESLNALRGRGPDGKATANSPDMTPFIRVDGEALVRKGNVAACIIIPKGFEEMSTNMFGGGGGLKVDAVVDPAHKAEAGLLTGKLNELAFKQMTRSFSNPKLMTAQMDSARKRITESTGLTGEQKHILTSLFDSLDSLASANLPDPEPSKDTDKKSGDKKDSGLGGWRPVDVNVSELTVEKTGQPHNTFEISFPQGVVWGLMGCMMAFGVSLAMERTAGTMLRLAAAPITRGQILLGKALACFTACVIVQAMLLAMGTLIGKLHITRWDIAALAVVSCSIGFSGLMMVIAGISKSEGAAGGMGRGVVIMLALIGGGSVPLFILPPLVQKIASVSPFKWASQAIEGAVWRGYTFHDMLLPVGVLLGMGVIGYAIGASAMKRTMA
jgi:ABC-2 type transport system permease protein